MKQKKWVLLLLVTISVVFTSGSYAYWFNVEDASNDNVSGSIEVGSGESIGMTVSVADAANTTDDLVPTAFVSTSPGSPVDTIELTYSVSWVESGSVVVDGSTGDLTVSVTEVRSMLGGGGSQIWAANSNIYGDMFTIVITGDGEIVAGTDSTVTVSILFATAPASQAIYNQVANNSLELDLDFSVIAD